MSALCSIGPRQTTASSSSMKKPIDMTFRPWRLEREDLALGRDLRPLAAEAEHARDRVAPDVGVEHADALALGASAAARLAVSEDLPTPPLPEPTQMTFATWASAPSGSPPARPSLRCSAPFSWSERTSKPTLTRVTPSSARTASATAVWKWLRIGQPGVVSETVTSTTPSVVDVDGPDHLELDDVAPQLGVDDGLQRLEDLLSRGHGLIVAGAPAARSPRHG